MQSARDESDHTHRARFSCTSGAWTGDVHGQAGHSSPANSPVPAPLEHGVNALNTSGRLPAVMKNVLFAGLAIHARTALKSLHRHCPKH